MTNAFRQHELSDVLKALSHHRGRYFLVGGAVRDGLLGEPANDLDIAVPNDDEFAHLLFSTISSGAQNRHGNWRFELPSGQHVDLIQPQNFYKPFRTVLSMLAFFDTSVNAIGIDLGDPDHILDPIDGIDGLRRGQLTLPHERWTTLNDFESVHLALRTLRLLGRHPLTLSNPSLLRAQIPKFDLVEWSDLYRLNRISRGQARDQLLSICDRPLAA
ncbi:hypothetical protein [Nocardioides conyzicola]|uniref:hypothetical protein n=1 Tax=Nocardioides conyzicola TaxID=1651781 RepID=UPI0031E9408E